MENLRGGIRPLPISETVFTYVLSESRSPLWADITEAEAGLQKGKVQNLRIAASKLNGLKLGANETFSFWKQLGRATRRNGYVVGRQLREGCIYPEIGGGICQLSNALFDAADRAGLQIVERHPHTQVIPGSLAEAGRDATVSWNYIDLRFRSREPVQFEVKLTCTELIVRVLAATARAESVKPLRLQTFSRTSIDVEHHSCATCGEAACFRHAGARQQLGLNKAAFLVDEVWPEFQAFVREARSDADVLLLPVDGVRYKKPRYAWETSGFGQVRQARWETAKRSLISRRLGAYGAARLESQLNAAEDISLALAKNLDQDVETIHVAQTYLPFLWRRGYLGGRKFTILAHRLPLRLLHARLDEAAARHPERKTLSEFRAPEHVTAWEWEAFKAADRIVTPNSEIADLFGTRAQLLPWQMPTACSFSSGTAIVFPGPTAARKGAFEVREAARALGLRVILLGTELEGENFWAGVETQRMSVRDNWLDGAGVLVQPSLVEERPRSILKAQSAGLPVVMTSHCGVRPGTLDRLAEYGCVEGLQMALQESLGLGRKT
jgi:hypothetical protein